MTTDDKTLTEQIAGALAEVDGYGPTDMHVDWVMRYYGDFAVAVLPIIRKAQADAWDEGQESGWGSAREESDQHGGVCDMWKPHVWLEPNPYREEQNR